MGLIIVIIELIFGFIFEILSGIFWTIATIFTFIFGILADFSSTIGWSETIAGVIIIFFLARLFITTIRES